ncbi:hypothetical protein SBA1_680018 [Candidatus Sulfotelmatobacter kueseliae]|uniref:Uncharacterized protein n=1 Tax=Candidatus Sulfotelmatobacter kueseliae TaxID=2042962 RepID=A0A2U3L4C4_9BACT|nr:hypothetical protein SBA1_680018 [Candidatus Sulfotelmatobacter kueseliae]
MPVNGQFRFARNDKKLELIKVFLQDGLVRIVLPGTRPARLRLPGMVPGGSGIPACSSRSQLCYNFRRRIEKRAAQRTKRARPRSGYEHVLDEVETPRNGSACCAGSFGARGELQGIFPGRHSQFDHYSALGSAGCL